MQLFRFDILDAKLGLYEIMFSCLFVGHIWN